MGCGYYGRCWPRAEAAKDVALVYGVDQNLAVALRQAGVVTVDALLARFDEAKLAGFQRPWGERMQRVGKKAGPILLMAQALASEKETLLKAPDVPDFPNCVMFDLEGLPPHLDELDKVYLWGLQVFGKKPGDYLAATAGFGAEGDREGWEDFLAKADQVFAEYGNLPFVHWHHYERVKIDAYVERYGDIGSIAARVRRNLLDLLPITRDAIALPLPSYILKVIEKYIGFKRTQEEYGGDWAIAKYIEATEMADEEERSKVMDQFLTYNREDLAATWAVLRWLKGKAFRA
jgi:predicted RecB family nuclease